VKVIVIGATGTIGQAVVAALEAGGHEVVPVSRTSGALRADITDKASLERAFAQIGAVDAIVSAAGGGVFKPLAELSDADFARSLGYKLMGQVNVVRAGAAHLSAGGSLTLTSGTLARNPSPGSAAISLVNAGLEGFVRAAALELRGRARVNVVSPPWVAETLAAMGRDPSGGMPAADVAKAYLDAVTGAATGALFDLG
jgi:NAD(P)-dependent dehydrogenase (short-subunit alcohol dehydrogenase family)